MVFPCVIYLTGGRLACVDFSVDQERLPFVGKFDEKIPSNGTGIFLGTENRNIELYHLQNTGKFFAFSRLEGWYW